MQAAIVPSRCVSGTQFPQAPKRKVRCHRRAVDSSLRRRGLLRRISRASGCYSDRLADRSRFGCRPLDKTAHGIGSVAPALAENARTGHPQFRNGKERL